MDAILHKIQRVQRKETRSVSNMAIMRTAYYWGSSLIHIANGVFSVFTVNTHRAPASIYNLIQSESQLPSAFSEGCNAGMRMN